MTTPGRRPRFEVGTSPFRAKGIVFLTTRAFYDQRVPGGSAAVAAAIDAPTRAFFEQRFLTGGWYDLLPILTLSAAAGRLHGSSASDLLREGAAWQATRDLSGIYRVVVAIASAAVIAKRLPALSKQYFDFGDADGDMLADKLFESRRTGIPAPLGEWFTVCTSGYVPIALAKAGARNVRVKSDSTEDGEAHGVPTVRIRFEISWD